jgi:signal transduction histidine kinase
LQWFFDVRTIGAPLTVLVITYTLGVYERRRWVLAIAVVVAETGVVMAVTRWGPYGEKAAATVLMSGTVTAAWVLGIYARTRRAYLKSVLDRALAAERDRDSRATIAVADERARMAREMHDVIAHSMSVMITLSDAAAAVESTPEARQAMKQVSTVGRQALTEMRRLLGVYRDRGPAELTPAPQLHQLSDIVSQVRAAGLPVELVVGGDLQDAPASAQLVTYRVVQESLTNVLKHARNVRHTAVEIQYDGAEIQVRVRDDGEHRVDAGSATDGYGLLGMRERAAIFDGEIIAGPLPGRGWQVETILRLDPDRQTA